MTQEERPIIFNAEMVSAILAGRKTQTRRPMKPQPEIKKGCYDDHYWTCFTANPERKHPWPNGISHDDELIGQDRFAMTARSCSGWRHHVSDRYECPYGQPGDRLWVREAFRLRADQDDKPPSQDFWKSGAWYAADSDSEPSGCGGGAGKLRSPIYMPRWASRIMLELTGVRVERVREIVAENAKAEGIPEWNDRPFAKKWCKTCDGQGVHAALGANYGVTEVDCADCHTEINLFRNLWDSINAKRGFGWDVNPWVWVIEFKVIRPEGLRSGLDQAENAAKEMK